MNRRRADLVAAWATGTGIGWLAFMVTWLVAARITERILPVPEAPVTAMAAAIVTGLACGLLAARRLIGTVNTETATTRR